MVCSFFLINGGGDIFATSEFRKPITVYLEHPTLESTYLGTIDLRDQGFASSSPHKRTWEYNGRKYNHIIDTTENPRLETKPDASFVIAHSATKADTIATVLLLTSVKESHIICNQEKIGFAVFTLPDILEKNQFFDLTLL